MVMMIRDTGKLIPWRQLSYGRYEIMKEYKLQLKCLSSFPFCTEIPSSSFHGIYYAPERGRFKSTRMCPTIPITASDWCYHRDG